MEVENNVKIMGFKKFILKYFKTESLKDQHLNKILDKIKGGANISKREKRFLDNYDDRKDEDIMDYHMMDKLKTFNKITDILEREKKIICNLTDRNGKVGIEINTISNNYQQQETIIYLTNDDEIILKDNYLYNIIYNFSKDTYSLEEDEEYFEKIPVQSDENF